MPESAFYAKAMQGASRLVGHWLLLGQATPDRLAMILADTARLAKLGEPEVTPSGDMLSKWSDEERPPLWAARTSLFLLVQMPSRPIPRDEPEACAWAYCWLRNRHFDDFNQAHEALPDHLHETLKPALEWAWADKLTQRLI
ncbi:hypothetical protein ACPF7Z_17745 [Halomonas sp. GXIMD04776]|uniref:hypothetical protein n=1 Tax=Halomonas sp. GXIMD04776 TaxID=3415605 RepID=UPI003CAD5EF9